MNETTTFRWSLEEDIARYAAAGIPALGVWRQKLSDCGQRRAAELIRRHGLEVSHLHWVGGFTGSEGRSYRESVEDGREAILAAAALNARCVVVYTGPRAGHTFNHAHRLVRDALDELADSAGEHGVTLAIEPMHPGCAEEWTFLTSLDQAMGLITAVDRPEVGLLFDTYQLGHEGGIVGRVPEVAPWVALVQLGDACVPPTDEQNRCLLGEGRLPLKELVAALLGAGYDGYFDVELLGEAVEPYDYTHLLDHARRAYEELVGAHVI
ncbi:MAG: sugar phosphate isomerase/epimerase family protein [Pirellulales bacterium]